MANKRNKRAQAAHDRWLRSFFRRIRVEVGHHERARERDSLKVENPPGVAPTSDRIPPYVPQKRAVTDRMQLDQEREEVRKEILRKKGECAPQYNKGPYQYSPDPKAMKENKRRE